MGAGTGKERGRKRRTQKDESRRAIRDKLGKEELVKMGYMPIREVARKSGVEKSTIHFYVSEGLLPKPVMVSRQMAYYPPETVERVKLIKQLQRRFLPLKEIKKILKGRSDIKEVLEKIDENILSFDSFGKKFDRESTNIPREIINQLEKIGIIKSAEKLSFYDVEILKLVWRMREAGLNEKLRFSVDFLKNYYDMCRKLVDMEFAEFNSKVIGKVRPEVVIELAKEGIEGTSEILKLLHKKLLFEKLEELRKDMEDEFRNSENRKTKKAIGEEKKKTKKNRKKGG